MSDARNPAHSDPEHGEMIARVEHAHRDLRELLTQLAGGHDFESIAAGLRDLPKTLDDHFADEEAPGGLYDGLRHRRPACESEITRLCGEHVLLRDHVGALLERVQAPGAGSGGEAELASLREAALIFIDLLRGHERVETQLVSEIYYCEDGGSG
jgi:hypothetical protein